jgi:hypothetical protein
MASAAYFQSSPVDAAALRDARSIRHSIPPYPSRPRRQIMTTASMTAGYRSLHGGVEPSLQSSGPASRLAAAGLSSCPIVLPATQPHITNAATIKVTMVFMAALSPRLTLGDSGLERRLVSAPVLHRSRRTDFRHGAASNVGPIDCATISRKPASSQPKTSISAAAIISA